MQVELCPRTVELASIIETLAADIARLNTLAIPEHTVPAGTAPAGDVPTGNDSNDNNPEVPPQQQLDA